MFFSDEDRRVYSYHDGRREVRADPLAVRRRLAQAANGDLAGVWKAASAPPKTGEGHLPAETAGQLELARLEGEERLLGVIRYAFDLPPVDPATGEGVTEAMC